MKILALDPSSTLTGYAVLADARTVLDVGLIRPNRTRDAANERIRAMATDVLALIGEHRPDVVVVEDTSGKVGRRGRARGMNGAGLAVHGKAVGWILSACESAGVRVEPVAENDWTRGVRKATRQARVAAEFKGKYDPARDGGGDAADAIGLARWWFVSKGA